MMFQFFRNYVESFRSLSLQSRIMLFIYMTQCISAGVAFFIAIYLKKHLNIEPEIIGMIVSLFAAGNLSGAFVSAKILDKVNPHLMTAMTLVIQGFCFLNITFTTSIYNLAISMYFLGVSGYAYVVSSEYLIVLTSGKKEKTQSISISFINVSSNMGVGLGGMLVALLSDSYPRFLLEGIGCFLILLSLYYFWLKKFTYVAEVYSDNEQRKTFYTNNKNLYQISLFFIFVLGLVFAQQRVSYSLYLEKNFGGSGISTLLLLNSILIILFQPSINGFSENRNKVVLMGLGGVMLAGGMAFYQFTNSYLWVLLLCVITTFGEMIGTLLSQYLCFESANSSQKGRAMGYYKFLYALGTILGTAMGGFIQQHLGINSVWRFCGVLAVLMLIPVYLNQRKAQILSRPLIN